MSQAAELFLVIDQSTSATKAMLVSLQGEVIDQLSISHTQIYPKPGWVEHDPEEILSNTYKAIKELIQRQPRRQKDIIAVSITNQRETFVVFDRESGKPLYNAIVWQCQRGDSFCRSLISSGKEDFVHQKTGLIIDTYFPASKLHWLIETYPEINKRLQEGTALFGTIDTFLLYRFTKGKVYATDFTNASRTLFFDIEKLGWSKELCETFQLAFSELPEVRESSAFFGSTDLGGILDHEIPIHGVIGDSQAAMFAQRCFSPGDAKVTFGTGSSILLNISHKMKLSHCGNLTALAWVLNGKPTYAFEGIINFSGATISWMQNQLQIIDDPAETEEMARSIPDCGGVFFIPAFSGLSAPYWRSDVRAAFLGISLSTTRVHMVRAGLESIGYIVTDVIKDMAKEMDINLIAIRADGGASENAFLMQFISDLNQINMQVAQSANLSAIGAFLNGMLGMKYFSSIEEFDNISTSYKEYNPIIDKEKASTLFQNWQKAVQQILHQ